MIRGFYNWLDHRTGYRKLMSALLIEHIPGGAKWRYVWGSVLAFVFLIQLITGILLMTAYSPSTNNAWGSVYYIQYEMDFGWLIRGLHHYGSQTMVVLLGIHMFQVVIAGAHLPPREVNWWLGLLLMGVVLALSLTGYLLPWDQKGYFATKVATNIAGSVPVVGPSIQKFIVGGPEYGNHTLSRFYALHVGILPALMILLIILHLAVFRRHGVTRSTPPPAPSRNGEGAQPESTQRDGWFWPDQAFRDLLVGMLVLGLMLGLVVFGGQGNTLEVSPEMQDATLYEKMAHAGRDGRGAHLDAPADPATANYPARPEWYFLFLFQLLKYFEGDQEIVGTVIIPAAAGGILFLLPLLGYGRMRKFGHAFGVFAVVFLLFSVVLLTVLAWDADRLRILTDDQIAGIAEGRLDAEDPDLTPDQKAAIDGLSEADRKAYEKARDFRVGLHKTNLDAKRAVELAHLAGIPPEGSHVLLRRDPKTQGPILFRQHCASCHSHTSDDPSRNIVSEKPTASDLGGFGSRDWVRGLLANPDDPRYFGNVKNADGNPHFKDMSEWVRETLKNPPPKDPDGEMPMTQEELGREFDQIADWLAKAPREPIPSVEDGSEFARGFRLFERHCIECHQYQGKVGNTATGPDFTGYGDREWLEIMLQAPNDRSRYRRKNLMPLFRDLESPGTEFQRLEYERMRQRSGGADTVHAQISDRDRELIIRWLIGAYVGGGGSPRSK